MEKTTSEEKRKEVRRGGNEDGENGRVGMKGEENRGEKGKNFTSIT